MLYLIVPLAVLVAVIWALVVFPSFRIILVALGAIVYFSASEKASLQQKQEDAKKEQERVAFEARQKDYCQAEQKRWSIVPPSQIEIRNPSLTQNGQRYGVINDGYTEQIKIKSDRVAIEHHCA